jgi:dTDP-4-amino-4,6-dideoxygalactose transaminase
MAVIAAASSIRGAMMDDKVGVPFFDYPAIFAESEEELMGIMGDVLSRGAYIMQNDLARFEALLADYVGVKHAIGVADGTMGLLLPLMAMGLKQGDEVLVPAHTFVASAAAIHHAGGVPVLVDCDEDHLISSDSAEQFITERTRAIMPVQLNGRVAKMDRLQSLAEKHGLSIIEDACQALGAKYQGQSAGSFGLAASISFYPSKTLGCFGDGGAVVTNDDELAERIRLLRDHGRASDGNVVCWGFNSRLDNLQAAVLLFKLEKKYAGYIDKRRALAAVYDERLREVPELKLPPGPHSDEAHYDIFQNYEIEADRRDSLREHLSQRGIGTIIQWGGRTINTFKDLGLDRPLPYTDEMTKRFMLLPMNTALTERDVHHVCDHIESFYSP